LALDLFGRLPIPRMTLKTDKKGRCAIKTDKAGSYVLVCKAGMSSQWIVSVVCTGRVSVALHNANRVEGLVGLPSEFSSLVDWFKSVQVVQ
jgi:hypothetical protein